jgi:hypothetical protein
MNPKKKSSDSKAGKITTHGDGLGLPDRDDVLQRAEELASIEGHAPSGEDRERAEHELAGDTLPPTTEDDAESVGALSRDPSEPRSIPGRQIPDQEDEGGQSTVERLVAEGVNEADHDQMLAARRQRKRAI